MTWAGFTSGAVTAVTVVFAAALHAANGQQGVDQLRLQQQMGLLSAASAAANRGVAAGARGVQGDGQYESTVGPAAPDSQLVQRRSRLEQDLKVTRELSAALAADPDSRRRDRRFGVGYEWRMRDRQQLGFESAGGGGRGGGFGAGRR